MGNVGDIVVITSVAVFTDCIRDVLSSSPDSEQASIHCRLDTVRIHAVQAVNITWCPGQGAAVLTNCLQVLRSRALRQPLNIKEGGM